VAELPSLQTADEAAGWAHRNLPAKNTLTAADAELVEAGFRAQLATFSDGKPAKGPHAAVQKPPEVPTDLSSRLLKFGVMRTFIQFLKPAWQSLPRVI
jgi:hypothetical protein